ncbi:diaminopimelate decarboxylase [Candidatus Woesearchaeota archaeon]|nr:diaminopimelate decarboxylase [Candidatus Woesearchaeota archaeon]
MKTRNNRLMIGEIEADQLVKKYGSPIYVYDEEIIRNRFRELKESIPYRKLRIYYACKANTNPHIMKIMLEEGAYIDAISPGEIMMALKAGFKPEQLMFTSTSVTDEDMKFAIEKGVLVNCDSLSQLERYGKINPQSSVSIRINPDVGAGHHGHVITGGPDSKFGIYFDKLHDAQAIAKKHNLRIIGVHQHIGSGIIEKEKFIQAMAMLLKTANEIEGLEFIDFGGGLGVPYKPGQERLDIKKLGMEITEKFTAFCSEYGKELHLYIEPGRYPVAEAGTLLCTVNTIKETPKHKFAGVDTGFNHLVRPAMYGSYHEIINASNVEAEKKQKIAIAGNICESGDVFTRDEHGIVNREMPEIKEGDVLAILNAGAYGYSMSSNYNTRPRPAEILVKGKEARVIRKRETFEHLEFGLD